MGSMVSAEAELLPPHSRLCIAACESGAKSQQQTTPPRALGKQCCPRLGYLLHTHHLCPALGKCGAAQGFQARAPSQAPPQAEAGWPPSNSPLTSSVPHHPTVGSYSLQTTLHGDLLIVLVPSKDRERKTGWLSAHPLHDPDSESTVYEH